MSDNTGKPREQAQIEKKQAAARDGEKAMAQYDADAIAVRANMEKLRALRLAKEAAEAAAAPAVRPKKAAAKKSKEAAAPAKLSDWLAEQQKGGFRT